MNQENFPVLDFNKICRICLLEEPEMTNIFVAQIGVVPLPLRIMACASVEITATDTLPGNVCNVCLYQIDSWYRFKDMCESADTTLRKLYGDDKINYEEVCKIQSLGRASQDIFRSLIKKSAEVSSSLSSEKGTNDLRIETLDELEQGEVTTPKRKVEFVECNKCYKYFNKRSLPLHMAQSHGRKRKSASRKKPRRMPKLRTLIKIINGGPKHKETKVEDSDTCKICGAEFICESELIGHMSAEHDDKDQVKKENDSDTSERKTLRRSTRHDQEMSIFLDDFDDDADESNEQMCNECCETFPNESELLLHKFMDHHGRHKRKSVIMQCPDCTTQFNTNKSLYDHIREKHRFRCVDCNDGFSTSEKLKDHMLKLGDHKEQYQCQDCGLSFDDEAKLAEHMRKKVQCDICNKIVSRPTRLIEHKLVKHNIGARREYQCEICGKGFPYATSLRYHKRIHGEKNIICSMCGKTFHFLCNYNVHMDLHHSTVEDKVICELCGGLYPKCKMRDHLARHSKPSLPCDMCGKLFRLKSQLNRHKMQFHKDTPYTCPLCSKGFVKTANLEAHLCKQHNQTDYRVISKLEFSMD